MRETFAAQTPLKTFPLFAHIQNHLMMPQCLASQFVGVRLGIDEINFVVKINTGNLLQIWMRNVWHFTEIGRICCQAEKPRALESEETWRRNRKGLSRRQPQSRLHHNHPVPFTYLKYSMFVFVCAVVCLWESICYDFPIHWHKMQNRPSWSSFNVNVWTR